MPVFDSVTAKALSSSARWGPCWLVYSLAILLTAPSLIPYFIAVTRLESPDNQLSITPDLVISGISLAFETLLVPSLNLCGRQIGKIRGQIGQTAGQTGQNSLSEGHC